MSQHFLVGVFQFGKLDSVSKCRMVADYNPFGANLLLTYPQSNFHFRRDVLRASHLDIEPAQGEVFGLRS